MDSISQAQKQMFMPLLTQRMEKFATLPPEIQAKGMELYNKMQTDPAVKAQSEAQAEATFKAADTEGTGVLNKAKFTDFTQKLQATAHAKIGGEDPMKSDEETIGKWYDAVNTLSPDVEGVTYADYQKVQEIMKHLMAELMAKKKE